MSEPCTCRSKATLLYTHVEGLELNRKVTLAGFRAARSGQIAMHAAVHARANPDSTLETQFCKYPPAPVQQGSKDSLKGR